jgi:hypothetical protein
MEVPARQVRAVYTHETITVYQAYPPEIAEPAVRAGRFVPPFKRERMTWIKPSFLWMMYRCGWGAKPGQERVLAVEITRSGFEWALARACLSSFEQGGAEPHADWSRRLRRSPVRVQWDPERSIQLGALPHRSLQVGLGGEAAERYADDWTVAIRDVTELAHRIRATRDPALLPAERPYPLAPILATAIRAST